jgi:hypothetical protein
MELSEWNLTVRVLVFDTSWKLAGTEEPHM